jgi:hypothetical protein
MVHITKPRIPIKFCFNLKKPGSGSYKMLKKDLSDNAISRKQTSEWLSYFKSGWISVEDF